MLSPPDSEKSPRHRRSSSNVAFSFTETNSQSLSEALSAEETNHPEGAYAISSPSQSTSRGSSRPSAMYLSVTDPYGNSGQNQSTSGPSSPVSSANSPGNSNLRSKFTLGGGSTPGSPDSTPTHSRDSSPARSYFPEGEPDDPYARKHRPNLSATKEVASRFQFSSKSKKGSSASLHSLKTPAYDSDESSSKQKNSRPRLSRSGSSMMELKRFFKPSKKNKSSLKQEKSGSKLTTKNSSSGSLKNMPFAEDGFKKYGKIGHILGSGAGGSVRLMKRTSDGTTFAIKEFRPRHANESQREYSKKVTAEFCIGSTLHHANVIETLDIIHDNGKVYEVMEYCPYDFFAVVMSGKMSKEEIGCTFKQIINGVTYLHELGLAHRDLKLDNCVVTAEGIVKIIDFGSASVFRYPFESGIVRAQGVVGSDPYLAPEVLVSHTYDPRPVDIWSIAVIFCCMTLKRFPWKVPRPSDNSFMLFSSKPTKEEEYSYHHPSPEPKSENSTANGVTTTTHKPEGSTATPHKAVIKGPWRLLRLLPHESRNIIGRMLELDPERRATLDEIWEDEWIKNLQMCTITKEGVHIKSTDHEHTTVEDDQAHLEAYKK